ncbi:hypothetical protein GCM10011369_19900 [Neiella marina]|uniref:Uncharacterized protein n=1 Tax=Neiella marina TaxID=508461 RepID=A0A8J2U5A0_9GAMM|nr:hypothetical protein [Neiella marina]GGA78021.1 hypothetical protein GCM10011369_19900 [Neiella marina]
MATNQPDASSQLDIITERLDAAFEALTEAVDDKDIAKYAEQINFQAQLLDGIARELCAQLTAQNQAQIEPLLRKISLMTKRAIGQAESQKESAKQGILALRQTSAGVNAYQQIKKVR